MNFAEEEPSKKYCIKGKHVAIICGVVVAVGLIVGLSVGLTRSVSRTQPQLLPNLLRKPALPSLLRTRMSALTVKMKAENGKTSGCLTSSIQFTTTWR